MPDGAVPEEPDVGGPATDVEKDHAQLTLVGIEHGFGRGERLQHDVVHRQAGAVDRAHHVVHRGDRASDDVHLDLEPHPRHPDGLADAVLLVDDERLREHVNDLAVLRQVDGPRGVDGALDVDHRDFAVLVADGDDAAAVDAPDVAAGDARVHARHFDPGHLLGLAHGLADRLHGRVDVHDDPLAQATGRRRADSHHVDAAAGVRLGDDRADLRRADVEPDDVLLESLASYPWPPFLRTTWSRKRRSIAVTPSPVRPICASTPASRANRSSHSSAPSRTSMPSTV